MKTDRLIKLAQLMEGTETELSERDLCKILDEIHSGKVKAQKIPQLLMGYMGLTTVDGALEATQEANEAASKGHRRPAFLPDESGQAASGH
jgi:aspartokinase